MYVDAMRSMATGFSRREMLGMGGKLGLAAALGGVAAGASGGVAGISGRGPLDLGVPADNIYAFAKMWGTLGDEPVFGAHEGVFFALVGQRRAQPLFGYVGFGSLQFRILPNGDGEYRGKDATFYTDLKTGKLLDTWQNPFTGRAVQVYPYINSQVTTTLPSYYPAERMVTDAYRWQISIGNGASRREQANAYRGDQGESGEKVPFILPWRRIGGHYLLSWDWLLEVANPVTPEGWPEASTGPVINPSEHFSFFVPAKELEDRGRPWAPMTAGFYRQCPWLPWMRMGKSGVEGRMFASSHSYKLSPGLDNIPPVVRSRLERDWPDLLKTPTDWSQHPVGSSWGYYAKTAPREG